MYSPLTGDCSAAEPPVFSFATCQGQLHMSPTSSFLGYGWGFLLASPGAPLYLAGVPLGGQDLSPGG